MAHDSVPGAVFSYKGHTLMADEAHALVYGSVGLLVGSTGEVSKALRNEPHYAVGAFIVTYLIGRRLAAYEQRQRGDSQ